MNLITECIDMFSQCESISMTEDCEAYEAVTKVNRRNRCGEHVGDFRSPSAVQGLPGTVALGWCLDCSKICLRY